MLSDLQSNPLLLTDAYSLSHQRLKINTDFEVSHIYNRTSGMVLFGFHETVLNTFDIQITKWMVDDAIFWAKKMNLHFPTDLWMKVVTDLGGKIPIKVEALVDGTWVPKGTPFAQISNTVKGFGELVTWWEGLLLHAYFPSACATEAFQAKKYLIQAQQRNGYDDSFLNRFHSFGFRGHRSLEDAYWADIAWNLFLFGTDNIHSIRHTPNAPISSISALAHKVTQQFDNEFASYIHAVDATKAINEKVIAIVIDTFNADRFIERYAVQLANYAAEAGIHVVFRPDSGNVLNQAIAIYTKCVEIAGCKNTSVIIGMDMSFQKAKDYDFQLLNSKIPLNYVSYGIGAGYYKHLERDTLGWAMKTAFSNGRPRMKFSNDNIKQSIPGIVKLVYDKDGQLIVFTQEEYNELGEDLNQYNILYDTDYILPYNWEQVKQITEFIDDSQQTIILSNGIKALTEEIKMLCGLDPL